MPQRGRPRLGAFAFHHSQKAWMVEAPDPGHPSDIVWQGEGPCDVPILVRRDGFFIFDFGSANTYAGGAVPLYDLEESTIPSSIIKLENARRDLAYSRFSYMNSVVQALSSGISIVQHASLGIVAPLNPSNYFNAVKEGDKWRILHTAPFPTTPNRNFAISKDTLDHMLELLAKSHVALGSSFVDMLALTHVASHQYSLHQFPSAHLIAWSVVEKLINHMWDQLQHEIDEKNGGFTKMDSARRDLLDGRDYTASVITQFLSFNKKVDDKTLDDLNKARARRNKFAHNLAPIVAQDAGGVIQLATKLMSTIINYPVTFNLQMSFKL
jgi:hypothetical protein